MTCLLVIAIGKSKYEYKYRTIGSCMCIMVTHFLEICYELMFVVYTTKNDTNVQIYSLSK